MGDSFLISIDCSKILADSDEAQYTMFIDTSKMSIVYELAEWIRWMFSLETCFYITHDNSVIHELEDIQVLSRLKNFELKPCGRSHCVHQKGYRKLLKNLNLFVSWKGMEVHKYFLQKLNKVDQIFTQENNRKTESPMISTTGTKDLQSFVGYKNTEFDNAKNIDQTIQNGLSCKNGLPKTTNECMSPVKKRPLIGKLEIRAHDESSMEMNCSKGNLSSSKGKSGYLEESSFAVSENLSLETKKSPAGTLINTNSVKNKFNTAQEPSKNCDKPYSRKYVKPFSLGEILSNIREQNKEPIVTKNSPSSNHFYLKEGDFDENMSGEENSFIGENKKIRRKRIRKRKSKRKDVDDEFFPQFLDKNKPDYSLDFEIGTTKPNHIRFDEDDLMETECVGDEPKTEKQNQYAKTEKQNQYEISVEELNNSNGFLNNIPKELSSVAAGDNTQCLSAGTPASYGINNSENKEDCPVNQFLNEDGLDYKAYGMNNQPYGISENFQPKTSDLNMLLSLKEKFKNAVIIERFY